MQSVAEALPQINQVIAQGPYAATWDSLRGYSAPRWYEEAKFGIFIHWGVYSVPAFGNEWYPRAMYEVGHDYYEHHRATYGPQDRFGYKDFVPQLTGARFDAAEWLDLFKASGARYVVPVAEHHDGFAMYDCGFSEWNALRMGPKRDVIGELAAATRQAGLVFGLSSHRAEHAWFFDGGRTFPSDVQDPRYASFYGPAQPAPANLHDLTERPPTQAFLDEWLARTCELVDKYQPQLVWFDWWIQQLAFKPYLQRFGAYLYNRAAQWGQGVALNYKYDAFAPGTAIFDVERGQLRGIQPMLWQTDTAVSRTSWGYVEGQQYKPVAELIGDLVDIVSKHGALLLNIGPRPDGSIPEPEQAILREIGRWLARNGDAIYGASPWAIFGEGPTDIGEGAFTDNVAKGYSSADIRFTCKDDLLYATVLAWPEDGRVTIAAMREGSPYYPGKPRHVQLLGDTTPVRWTRDAKELTVDLRGHVPTAYALVLTFNP